MPQNICIRSVNVFDKYIHQLHVTVNTHTHTHCNMINVNIKKLDV
jgi:hypothetical protein